MPPKNVVIVGGSLAGLIHGVQLRRNGSNVTILEQDPVSDRASHQAGISLGPNLMEFLAEYDATKSQVGIPAPFNIIAWRKYKQVYSFQSSRHLSSWVLLYRILRANFDGMPSEAVEHPPAPRDSDGRTEFRAGKRVTAIEYSEQKDLVTVRYVDVASGEKDSITADLVLGADGIHSTVRRLMQTETVTEKEYSGYVAWRGTVQESLVSAETAEYFSGRMVFTLMKSSYMLVYTIPTADGAVEPGKRLLNWVWYHNIKEDTPEMSSLFTDVDGNVHKNTIGGDLVHPEAWKRQLSTYISEMTPPVAELVSGTNNPFVTKVNDAMCQTPSFYDGRVVLVGDALAAARPHLAMASNQAAMHCQLLFKVWRGEITQKAWDREVMAYGKRVILLSRIIGLLGQGPKSTFLGSIVAYIWFLVKSRLRIGSKL